MAHAASVRLTLDDSGFRRTLTGTAAAVDKEGKRMGSSLSSALSSAAKGAGESLRKTFGGLASVVSQAMPFIGAAGIAALGKDALDTDAKVRKLAFSVRAGTGAVLDMARVQKEARASAQKWGQDSGALVDALDKMFTATGNADFAQQSLDAVASTARASGQDVGTLADIAAAMNEQFGVTANEMPDALAAVMSFGNKGGLSVQELGANLGKVGKLAGLAGMQGTSGLKTMLALINQIADASGTAEGASEKLNLMVRQLVGNESAKKAAKLEFGVKLSGDFVKDLSAVLKATGGDATKLSKIFGEGGAIVAQAFGGVSDLGAAMDQASRDVLTGADVAKSAQENMKGPSAQMAAAMEELKAAFASPEMVGAMKQLMGIIPPIASALAEIVPVIADNKLAFLSLAPALIGAKGAVGGFLEGLLSAKTGAGALGTAASGAAGNVGGLGGAAGGALLQFAAMTAAAGAVAMAFDQAASLSKELTQHDEDQSDQRETLLANEERQGRDYAVRERSEWDQLMGESQYEILTRGPGGGMKSTAFNPNEMTEYTGVSANEYLEADAERQSALRERAARLIADRGDKTIGKGEERIGRFNAPAEARATQPPGAPPTVKIDPASLVAQELRVRIMNPEDIRQGGGGTGTSPPTPGFEPRGG